MNRLLSATSQFDLKTVTGMVRAYDGEFIRSLSLKSMGPEINTEIIYKAQVLRIRLVEDPGPPRLERSDRAHGRASCAAARASTTSKLLVFAGFLFRPILFFIIPGILLLLISAWSAGSLLLTVLRVRRAHGGNLDSQLTNGFAHAWELWPQTFIIAGFTAVLSVQLISLGVLAAQAKRYFEELFYVHLPPVRRMTRAGRHLLAPRRWSSLGASPRSRSWCGW